MISVHVLLPSWGNACYRMTTSMKKFLPSDIELTMIWSPESVFDKTEYDIVIGYIGHGMIPNYWAYISPKAVISERDDDAALSCFGKNDVMFSYRQDKIDHIISKGVNAVSWSRPVDSDIFYKENCVKQYSVFTSGVHDDWPRRISNVLQKTSRSYLVIEYEPIDGVEAIYDVCAHGRDDAKLRKYYNLAYYHTSMVSSYEYYPGVTACGIETGNAEAAFCGCPSIILDLPGMDYMKHWYGKCGKFIKPDNFEEELQDVLNAPYKPLNNEEIQCTKRLFSAPIVWEIFWDQIREVLGK